MKIRSGDTVKVISGKDKNKEGKVVKVLIDKNRVIVEGINIVTKHMKKQGTTPGQILKIEKSVHVSTLMLVCPITKKPTRIGFVTLEEKGKKKKFRFSKTAVKETKKDPKDCIVK